MSPCKARSLNGNGEIRANLSHTLTVVIDIKRKRGGREWEERRKRRKQEKEE